MEKGNIIDYWDLAKNISPESFGIIWNEMDLRPENKNKQPSDDALAITKFIEEKKLPEEFYPFYKVNYELIVEKKIEVLKFSEFDNLNFIKNFQNKSNFDIKNKYLLLYLKNTNFFQPKHIEPFNNNTFLDSFPVSSQCW